VGQEISALVFESQDFDRFKGRLQSETELLRAWFDGNKFCSEELQFGLELEAWLIGQDGLPVPDNSLFLAILDRESVVPELSKFNFELNVLPQPIAGHGLRDMQSELRATWARCSQVAQQMNHRVLSIGILPTVTEGMLCLENMSPLKRYAALNEQVLRLRDGKPLTLEIQGSDALKSAHHDLMLESAATSVQVHLKVPQSVSVRYYNASLVASCFTVAMAANAPLLFGRRLWDDTRITLFEQAVDTDGVQPRVSFGHRYLDESLFQIFEDNLAKHRVLLPVELEDAPAKMPYVRMHNGTIWNWNRPLIGFESNGQPHLRIEHRPMSASPSVTDLFADVAFYLGITHFLATQESAPERQLPFEVARRNFYSAAKNGFRARIQWLDGNSYSVQSLLRERILDAAVEGMQQLRIPEDQIVAHRQTLMGRIESEQNGASWQRRKLASVDGDLQRLLLSYESHQRANQPVHTWSLL
jgi:gamma-glutamyl:cysteine ligase YbdK (ATP-grasp superfamily)